MKRKRIKKRRQSRQKTKNKQMKRSSNRKMRNIFRGLVTSIMKTMKYRLNTILSKGQGAEYVRNTRSQRRMSNLLADADIPLIQTIKCYFFISARNMEESHRQAQ